MNNKQFNPVLLVMQPRKIPDAIESTRCNWNIPKVWFRAFDEPGVLKAMGEFIKESNYSHYIITADDSISYKKAANIILNGAISNKYDIVTCWCNMHLNEDGNLCGFTNMTSGALQKDPTSQASPQWLSQEEVLCKKDWFKLSQLNFCWTCFPRDLILDFLPFGLNNIYGNLCASDHHLSYRIQEDGRYKIWSHPDAFCLHLRIGWGTLNEYEWFKGKIKPEIIYELEPDEYSTKKYEHLKHKWTHFKE